MDIFKVNVSAPIIDVRGADELIASIREDERVLNVVPGLAAIADTGKE